MKNTINGCIFDILCPKKWEQMTHTADQTVRHCAVCAKDVHRVDTVQQLDEAIDRGWCAAVVSEHDERLSWVGSVVADYSQSQPWQIVLDPVHSLSVDQIRALAQAVPRLEAMAIKARFEHASTETVVITGRKENLRLLHQHLVDAGLPCRCDPAGKDMIPRTADA